MIQGPSSQKPQRYQIPTHLNVPDTISLSFLGIPFDVTARQGMILLFGCSLAFQLWQRLAFVCHYGALGAFVRCLLPVVLVIGTILLATVKIVGRHPESWMAILLQYVLQPRIYVWRSVVTASPLSQSHPLKTSTVLLVRTVLRRRFWRIFDPTPDEMEEEE